MSDTFKRFTLAINRGHTNIANKYCPLLTVEDLDNIVREYAIESIRFILKTHIPNVEKIKQIILLKLIANGMVDCIIEFIDCYSVMFENDSSFAGELVCALALCDETIGNIFKTHNPKIYASLNNAKIIERLEVPTVAEQSRDYVTEQMFDVGAQMRANAERSRDAGAQMRATMAQSRDAMTQSRRAATESRAAARDAMTQSRRVATESRVAAAQSRVAAAQSRANAAESQESAHFNSNSVSADNINYEEPVLVREEVLASGGTMREYATSMKNNMFEQLQKLCPNIQEGWTTRHTVTYNG